MKREYEVYQINSFTQHKFSGNPAGVVANSEGLTTEEMLLIARELNNSETAFIYKPTEEKANYDVEVRFFTPTTEVPICGHATIAAHFVLATEKRIIPGQTILQKTKAGILPIEISETDGKITVKMTQGNIVFESIDPRSRTRILSAIGLHEEDIHPGCPVEIVSTGHSKVMIGIRSRKRLNQLTPDMNDLRRISHSINCNGYFVFTFDSDAPNILTHGRMFAPAIGIDEDPVTGNANGPLGAYIAKHKLVNLDSTGFSFTAKQGEALGRAGTVEVAVDISGGEPVKVAISGTAVAVFKTVIEL